MFESRKAISANETTASVESPCVRKCTLDDDDVCVGCFRTLDEICAWGNASNLQRQQILEQVACRSRKPGA